MPPVQSSASSPPIRTGLSSADAPTPLLKAWQVSEAGVFRFVILSQPSVDARHHERLNHGSVFLADGLASSTKARQQMGLGATSRPPFSC